MNRTNYLSTRGLAIPLRWRAVIGPLFALALLAAGLWNLSAPPLDWDGGWTLSIARTWVERGHYGRLMAGELYPHGLAASFPVTGLVALSFRLFGVGLWQGRLVSVLFMVAAVVVLYDLTHRLYNRTVALVTLAVLFLLSMHPELHPLTLGRQVLAEMPMMFFLLAGYTCFLLAQQRSLWFLLPTLGLWGLAVITKAQVLPFWMVSLAIPLALALLRREWRMAGLLGVALIGSYFVSQRLLWLQGLLLRGHTLPRSPMHGLTNVLALAPFSPRRATVLTIALTFGLPALLGLSYATWTWVKTLWTATPSTPQESVKLALLVLAGSWFAWYALMSAGFPRYLFPPTFVGSIFVAAMLYDLARYSRRSSIRKRIRPRFSFGELVRLGVYTLLALVLIALPLLFTSVMLYQYYVVNTDTSAADVARFLDATTPPDALIETYDSELHFFLNRRYHYPPDQTSVDIMRRRVVDPDARVNYDPLAADPDYLVVGPLLRRWQLYDPVLATGAFRLQRQFGEYDIYERVR